MEAGLCEARLQMNWEEYVDSLGRKRREMSLELGVSFYVGSRRFCCEE